MDFYNSSIISAKQFNRTDIEYLIEIAEKIEANKEKYASLLRGKIMATLFFERSTRTRLSFEAAFLRLGGSILSVTSDEASSVMKGETLADTIRTVSNYADIIVIRHSKDGAAKLAEKFSKVPVINAGSGSHEHPTQALLDVLTIKELKGTIDDLNIALAGDLRFGRTTHSLAYILSNFKTNLYFISPDQLRMQNSVLEYMFKKQIQFKETKKFKQVLPDIDVLYMTRIQKERFADMEEYEKVKDAFILQKEDVSQMKSNAIIMHPLPRINEINAEIDSDPRAKYFEQTYYGLMMRKALLAVILAKI